MGWGHVGTSTSQQCIAKVCAYPPMLMLPETLLTEELWVEWECHEEGRC